MSAPRIDHPQGCGCCEDRGPATPVPIDNRPGLGQAAYRVGTHAAFKRALLDALGRDPRAAGLTTRADDDWTVAFLDGFATMADVLAFYQERLANESWLRTATERRSVLELARLLGYQLRPGVAADATLAFTLDASPGAPETVTIEKGTAVQSTPKPGQTAQVYETTEDVEGRPAWNAMRPRRMRRHPLPYTDHELAFDGIATGITAGDGILWRQTGKAMFGTAVDVTAVPAVPSLAARAERPAFTIVTVRRVASTAMYATPAAAFEGDAVDLGPRAASLEGRRVKAADLDAMADSERFDVGDLLANFAACPPPPLLAWVFRAKARIFGHNAPLWEALPKELIGTGGAYASLQSTWPGGTSANLSNFAGLGGTGVSLDTTYAGLGEFAVLRDDTSWGAYRISASGERSIAAFALSGASTRLTLDATTGFANLRIRTTEVYLKAEALPLARVPIEEPVRGRRIKLDTWAEGLRVGQRVSITGEPDGERGTALAHVTRLARVDHDLRRGKGTILTLVDALPEPLVRDTVVVNANVAPATHGQSTSELLGDGDGRVPFARYALKQSPVTYTGVGTATGMASSLEVYVDEVRWKEVPALYGQPPDARVYSTRTDNSGKTVVQFGDGRTAGARPPTGSQSIRAVYRKGSGLGGNVEAGQLDVLLSRKVGLTGVVNRQPSDGGADPEALEDARTNAPLYVRTLGRVVSLRDYADFARAFPGVAKASAVWARVGGARGVLVTVAGPFGKTVAPGGQVAANLATAIEACGDPLVPVRIVPHVPRRFRVEADVKVDPDRVRADVVEAAKAALRAAFSFERRAFGQGVAPSEVVAALHEVDGVLAVELTAMYRSGQAASPPKTIPASTPAPGAAAAATGAELLTLDPGPIAIGVLS